MLNKTIFIKQISIVNFKLKPMYYIMPKSIIKFKQNRNKLWKSFEIPKGFYKPNELAICLESLFNNNSKCKYLVSFIYLKDMDYNYFNIEILNEGRTFNLDLQNFNDKLPLFKQNYYEEITQINTVKINNIDEQTQNRVLKNLKMKFQGLNINNTPLSENPVYKPIRYPTPLKKTNFKLSTVSPSDDINKLLLGYEYEMTFNYEHMNPKR